MVFKYSLKFLSYTNTKYECAAIEKVIRNAIFNYDDYQRILGPYPYNDPFGFHLFPNGWKLEPIESTPTNVSFE